MWELQPGEGCSPRFTLSAGSWIAGLNAPDPRLLLLYDFQLQVYSPGCLECWSGGYAQGICWNGVKSAEDSRVLHQLR